MSYFLPNFILLGGMRIVQVYGELSDPATVPKTNGSWAKIGSPTRPPSCAASRLID
jgi:hypothetical protein